MSGGHHREPNVELRVPCFRRSSLGIESGNHNRNIRCGPQGRVGANPGGSSCAQPGVSDPFLQTPPIPLQNAPAGAP